MIVIVAALGVRAAGLVGVAIPGAFLTGVLVLFMMGLSVNIVVLFALILSVGMLVDGAIVVTEYADRKMAEGFDTVEAYGIAAKRMAWPIIASTATTLAAFATDVLAGHGGRIYEISAANADLRTDIITADGIDFCADIGLYFREIWIVS